MPTDPSPIQEPRLGFIEMPDHFDPLHLWIEARDTLMTYVQTPEVLELLGECDSVIARKQSDA